MTIQKAAAAGVCAALIALQFKGGKTEYGIYVSIAAGLLLAAGILGKLDTVLATVREIGSFLQIEGSYLGVLLKMLGITYVAEFAPIFVRIPDTRRLHPRSSSLENCRCWLWGCLCF